MKFGFFLSEQWERDMIATSELASHACEYFFHPLDHDHLPEETDFEGISVFVDSVVDVAMLNRFPNLKFIATRSTGYDHIDLAVCQERGIVVANVPMYGANTVAEHAFALLLTLSKRIYDGYEQIKAGRGFDPHQLRGFDLHGKTLGVVGTGNIGKHAIAIGNGFGMNVIAYDAFPNEALQEELKFSYVAFDELLSQSDVVTIHVPYLEATHHLFNRESMQKMKEGSVLINTSRGAIVETEAIVEALAEGRLRGAGLDVFEEEGVVKDELHLLFRVSEDHEKLAVLLANHVLIDHPNVIVTPHSAFNTDEALRRIMGTTLENFSAFLAGDSKHNTVVK